MGNHEHNLNVVKKKAGRFVIQHRPKTDDVDYRHYVPCKYCFAYIAKQSLWKHSCALAPECNGDKRKKTRLHKSGASMVTESESADFSFFQGMRDYKLAKWPSLMASSYSWVHTSPGKWEIRRNSMVLSEVACDILVDC